MKICPFRLCTASAFAAAVLLIAFVFGCANSNGSIDMGNITTVAGDGTLGSTGNGGLATSAKLYQPSCAVADSAGNLYIGDFYSNNVRKVAAGTGIITSYAGNGTAGYSGDGGPAASASLQWPKACALDSLGDLFIADSGNNVIRKVAASSGIITTVAGIGIGGFSGDDGLATKAQISGPDGVAIDAAGNLFISDYGNLRVREVSASTGMISSIAGNGVYGNSGNGGAATSAMIANPEGLVLDAAGANLYIAEQGACVIAKVSLSTGVLNIVAGSGTCGAGSGGLGVVGDGGPATAAQFAGPQGVALDASGEIFISDNGNERVRMVSASTGIVSTVVGTTEGYSGDGGPSNQAKLQAPWGISIDASGNLYIADAGNGVVRKVTR